MRGCHRGRTNGFIAWRERPRQRWPLRSCSIERLEEPSIASLGSGRIAPRGFPDFLKTFSKLSQGHVSVAFSEEQPVSRNRGASRSLALGACIHAIPCNTF